MKHSILSYKEKHGAVQLAKLAGCSQRMIYEWLSFETMPGAKHAIPLVKTGMFTWDSIYEPYMSRNLKVK